MLALGDEPSGVDETRLQHLSELRNQSPAREAQVEHK